MNATRIISSDEAKRIESAIAEAEAHTSAELVCAVATESGRYDRAESLVGLVGSLLLLGAAHLVHERLAVDQGDWSPAALAIGWQSLSVVVGFIAGSVLASYCHWLRHLFVRPGEIDAEVRQAAWHVFGAASLRGTVGRSALLIYLSLFERRVVILADETAHRSLGEERIAKLRDEAVERLRKGTIGDACMATVESAGRALADCLPSDREVDADELSNHVLLFHPRPGTAG